MIAQTGLTLFASLAICVGTTASVAQAIEQPIWAKQATALDRSCSSQSRSIASPDHQSSVEVLCHTRPNDDPIYAVRVTTKSTHYDLPLDEGAHELLWAPNSRAFFIDGGTSSYAGFFVTVYRFSAQGSLEKLAVTSAAQGDMVVSFPPCKAFNRDPDETDCRRIAADPQFNMSGVAWDDDSSAIYVFAEVPCSSSYGGIMCQVLGYELSVPDGRILKRFTASDVSRQWRGSMAWDMHKPDPPRYGRPQ